MRGFPRMASLPACLFLPNHQALGFYEIRYPTMMRNNEEQWLVL